MQLDDKWEPFAAEANRSRPAQKILRLELLHALRLVPCAHACLHFLFERAEK